MLKKEKAFTVLTPSIDCETNAWQLIRLESGETGWVKKDDLEKNSSKVLMAETGCKKSIDSKCAAKVNEELKSLSIPDQDFSKSSEIFAKPFSQSGKVSFNKPDWQCVDPKDEGDDNYTSYPGGIGYSGTTLTAKIIPSEKNDLSTLATLTNLLDKTEKDLETKYKKPLSDPMNPFYGIGFSNLKDSITKCFNKQKYKLSPCLIKPEILTELLSHITSFEMPPPEEKQVFLLNIPTVVGGGDHLFTVAGVKSSLAVGCMGI